MKSNQDEKAIINFLHINCVRNYAIHSAIIDRYSKQSLKGNFWRVTSNSTLDYSIIQWCMLFGTNSESTHWKKQHYITCFENQILCNALISKADWQSLHNKVVSYRNNNAAHIDLENWRRDIPDMTQAMKILNVSHMLFNQLSEEQWTIDKEFKKIYRETSETLDFDEDEPI